MASSYFGRKTRGRRSAAPKEGWSPVVVEGRAIAYSFWGKAWCDNLESYADFANRTARGRTYVRRRAVVDLRIEAGVVEAKVAGSALYKTVVRVAALSPERWGQIVATHASGIDSVIALLGGALPKSLLQALADPSSGLFPKPAELQFSCSCPDWASMCKHVAAVLYGVGARLDQAPELFFRLRGVDMAELTAKDGATALGAGPFPDDLGGADLSALFGIAIDGGAAAPLGSSTSTPAPTAAAPKKAAARKKAAPPKKAAKSGK